MSKQRFDPKRMELVAINLIGRDFEPDFIIAATHGVGAGGRCTCGMHRCSRPGRHLLHPEAKDEFIAVSELVEGIWDGAKEANIAAAIPGPDHSLIVVSDARLDGERHLREME